MSRSAIRQRELVKLLPFPSQIITVQLCKLQLPFQTFHTPQSILPFCPKALDWISNKSFTKISWFKRKTPPLNSHRSLKTNFYSEHASSLSDYFTELLFSTTSETLAARWHEPGMEKKLNHKDRQPYLTALATGGLKQVNPATNQTISELFSTPAALSIQWLPTFFPVISRWNLEGHQWASSGDIMPTKTPFAH